MDTQSILESLQSISDQSGKEFLDLSTAFPILVSELSFAKKTAGKTSDKLEKFAKIQSGLHDALKKQEALTEKNGEVVANFQKRNAELVESFSSRLELLANMNELIQKIKNESSEMELISLNAMVVSIKSGTEGQAFSYITSNLKQLSLRLIAQSDALIGNEQLVQNNIAQLKETIADIEKISKASEGEDGTKAIVDTIEHIMQSLHDMLDRASAVRTPILNAMECIQMQDIIRQSLDDVLLTVGKIKDVHLHAPLEERLDQHYFNEKLASVSATMLDSINTKLTDSISVFKQNQTKINDILAEVEQKRKQFIAESLTENENVQNLQNCIKKTAQDFADFVSIFKAYQNAQDNVLDRSNAIQLSVQKIQLCFNDFFPIINNLQYVAIAQRIEVARNAKIKSIESTVEYMANLIVQTNTNVQAAQDMLQTFINNSNAQIEQFTEEANEDRTFFSTINRGKTSFIRMLSKLQKRFTDAVSTFTVYSADFFEYYENIANAISNLEELSQKLVTERDRLYLIRDESNAAHQSLMIENGITDWEIKNNAFNDFISHFTIVSDKQAVGSVTGLEVESGVSSGDITFF